MLQGWHTNKVPTKQCHKHDAGLLVDVGCNSTRAEALMCFMPDAAAAGSGYLFASFLGSASCRRCSIICITASFLCLLPGFLLGFFLFCSCHLLQQNSQWEHAQHVTVVKFDDRSFTLSGHRQSSLPNGPGVKNACQAQLTAVC